MPATSNGTVLAPPSPTPPTALGLPTEGGGRCRNLLLHFANNCILIGRVHGSINILPSRCLECLLTRLMRPWRVGLPPFTHLSLFPCTCAHFSFCTAIWTGLEGRLHTVDRRGLRRLSSTWTTYLVSTCFYQLLQAPRPF